MLSDQENCSSAIKKCFYNTPPPPPNHHPFYLGSSLFCLLVHNTCIFDLHPLPNPMVCLYCVLFQVPKIFWELSTKRLLLMEFMEGGQVNDKAYMERNGIDVNEVIFPLPTALVCDILQWGWRWCRVIETGTSLGITDATRHYWTLKSIGIEIPKINKSGSCHPSGVPRGPSGWLEPFFLACLSPCFLVAPTFHWAVCIVSLRHFIFSPPHLQ